MADGTKPFEPTAERHSAHETRLPAVPPSANDQRFTQRLRAFALRCRMQNGSETTITTVARNSSDATLHAESIFGVYLRGITFKQVV